jgi:uncharacterized protein YdaU (DUF1376 family)
MSLQWYARYPGDYMRDTGHLTLIEHGAYTRLLDHYYSTGRPIPPDVDALHRLCSAMDDAERVAVTKIASEFFPVNGDGLRHNKRADSEIVRMQNFHDRLSEAGRKGGIAQGQARLKPGLKPPPKPGLSISTSTSTSTSIATTGGERPPTLLDLKDSLTEAEKLLHRWCDNRERTPKQDEDITNMRARVRMLKKQIAYGGVDKVPQRQGVPS